MSHTIRLTDMQILSFLQKTFLYNFWEIHLWYLAASNICILKKAIGTRLSEICHSDSESPANILGFIYDEESKRRAKKEDEEEDYLDDSKRENDMNLD